jgi:hypothetical protein
MYKILVLLAAVILLAGCESAPVKEMQQAFKDIFKGNKGDPDLAAGIRSYESGNYRDSAKQLQSALDAGLSSAGQVQAHKYLAFIHCVSGRQGPCRDEFRKVLAADPDFELEPAEVGHPLWGPVFAKEKSRR